MKRILLVICAISAILLSGCNKNENLNNNKYEENIENQQQENINSGESDVDGEFITNSGENNINEEPKMDTKLVQEYINIINDTEAENIDGKIKYDLIYFNNDDVPDLVVGEPGYWVRMFLYDNGKVYNPIEKWPYGAFGNSGYDYEEKRATIFNSNSDYAGAIMTSSIQILNSNYEFDVLSVRALGAEIPEDDPQYKDVIEDIKSSGGYYYNGEKITEEEYNNKYNELIQETTSGEIKTLYGSKTALEIIAELKGKTISEAEKEYTDALEIGNERYNVATKFYSMTGLNLGVDTIILGEKQVERINNISDAKEVFTDLKFDKYVGRIEDTSDNMNSIIEESGEFYRLAADRGADTSYIKTNLIPKSIEENKIIFNAVSYYLSENGMKNISQEKFNLMLSSPDEFLKTSYLIDITIQKDEFTIVKEDGTWKVDEYVLPY